MKHNHLDDLYRDGFRFLKRLPGNKTMLEHKDTGLWLVYDRATDTHSVVHDTAL